MASEKDRTRLQVMLSPDTDKKVEELAKRMNISQAKMAEMLIDAAIEDNEWIIKAVTSRWAKAFADVLKGKKRRPKEA